MQHQLHSEAEKLKKKNLQTRGALPLHFFFTNCIKSMTMSGVDEAGHRLQVTAGDQLAILYHFLSDIPALTR